MHITINENLTLKLQKLANEVNLPAERLGQLFVEDMINSYLFTHDGTSALRDNITDEKTAGASQPEAHPQLCEQP
jgi:hypothetical protein